MKISNIDDGTKEGVLLLRAIGKLMMTTEHSCKSAEQILTDLCTPPLKHQEVGGLLNGSEASR